MIGLVSLTAGKCLSVTDRDHPWEGCIYAKFFISLCQSLCWGHAAFWKALWQGPQRSQAWLNHMQLIRFLPDLDECWLNLELGIVWWILSRGPSLFDHCPSPHASACMALWIHHESLNVFIPQLILLGENVNLPKWRIALIKVSLPLEENINVVSSVVLGWLASCLEVSLCPLPQIISSPACYKNHWICW